MHLNERLSRQETAVKPSESLFMLPTERPFRRYRRDRSPLPIPLTQLRQTVEAHVGADTPQGG